MDDRLQRIEDRQAISALVSAYTFAMDDQDLDMAADLFAEDSRFRSSDGVMDAQGREAICEQFRGRFAALSFSFHVTHDHMISFTSEDEATGLVSSHAEIIRNGTPMVAAMRYHDTYRCCADGKWRFADRLIKFFYYVPVDEYRDAMLTGKRMRAYGDQRLADVQDGVAG